MRDKNTGIVDIHGKQYQTVALRVKLFREAHPDWTLKTTIMHRDESLVLIVAEILDESGRLISNGHSEEYRGASSINKTSALENSETSAIGRALAALGYGGTEFCSADELVNAIKNKQPAPEKSNSVAKQTAQEMAENGDKRLDEARAWADECLACLPDEAAFYATYTDAKRHLDADSQVAMWGMLHGDSTPFPSANSVKVALKRGEAAAAEAELVAQA